MTRRARRALNIRDREADRLARKLAELAGETITQAVTIALQERLAPEEKRREAKDILVEEIMEISRRSAALSVYDPRPADEILGYDEHGLPH